MLSEFRNSLNSILYERVSSPLYGTVIVSWAIWNWKILYLTFFVNENKLSQSKIDYILNNYSDIHVLLTYPLVSAFLFLTIVPFLANGAYWLHLRFHQWKIEKKNDVEKNQRLTLKQSIQLREELTRQEKNFESLLSGKEEEIKRLRFELDEHKKIDVTQKDKASTLSDQDRLEQEQFTQLTRLVGKIKRNNELLYALHLISDRINQGYAIPDDLDKQSVGFYVSNDLIQQKSKGLYEFTPLGKNVYRKILEKKFK